MRQTAMNCMHKVRGPLCFTHNRLPLTESKG